MLYQVILKYMVYCLVRKKHNKLIYQYNSVNNEILFVVINYVKDLIFQYHNPTNTHRSLFLVKFSP